MHWKPNSRGIAAVALATTVGLLLTSPGTAAAKPQPPTPPKQQVSQHQVDTARSAKQRVANEVGQLSAEIAQAKIEVQQAQDKAELAEQRYALAVDQLRRARRAAVKAIAALQAAKRDVVKAHARFVQYVQASYMSGDVTGTTGSLLTAPDPTALLEQSALAQYQQQHQADAIGALEAATVARSNAEAAAKRAVLARTRAKAVAQQRKQEAEAAYAKAQQQKAALEKTMAEKQTELDQKQAELMRITAGRQATLRYEAAFAAYKVRLAAWQREQARKRRLARLAAERAAQRRAAAARASHQFGPAAPTGGNWSAAMGERAAQRAESQIGMPYAWAGGGAFGPSRGVCSPANGAPFDCNVVGYDCSGLAMYAWGAGWWAHFAAAQFTQAGSYHPSLGNLRAGDLLFWSYNGRIGGIHHVAVYIGHGQIVQAPFSGGFVEISSMYAPGRIFGATRPLT